MNVDVADDVPMIHGHHDALARALSNVMLNAVDACKARRRTVERARSPRERSADATRWRSRCPTRAAAFRPSSSRASGSRTSRRSRAARDSAWRSRGRRCSRTTARSRPRASLGAERRFDSCCRSTAAAMEREEAMRLAAIMVPIVLFICIAATAIGVPIARAYARRMERGPTDAVGAAGAHGAARAHGAGDRLDRDRGRAHLRRAAIHDEAPAERPKAPPTQPDAARRRSLAATCAVRRSIAVMPSVLIVDDEPNIRRMVGALLSAEGYEVRDAPDGAAGLARASRRSRTSSCSTS